MIRLAEAHARGEERLARLEERVDRLEGAVARLIEAQARLEEQVARLVRTQGQILRRMEHREGIKKALESSTAIFGATLEEAGAMVRWVLEQKGYRPIGQGYPLTL
ncbi:hypothetical protein [Thermoflexus sp.]|uniref:hypothetical protein n=1 Tax=Thermoflexus sp. TaxID=1969742 RepID=UPI0035E3F4AB